MVSMAIKHPAPEAMKALAQALREQWCADEGVPELYRVWAYAGKDTQNLWKLRAGRLIAELNKAGFAVSITRTP